MHDAIDVVINHENMVKDHAIEGCQIVNYVGSAVWNPR